MTMLTSMMDTIRFSIVGLCMRMTRYPDFATLGIRHRTFFVPGLGGYGSTSAFYHALPYFSGLKNIDVVDVGPFSTLAQRVDRLEKHIRRVYPEWSAENPINLVGHSFGCSTILHLVSRDRVDPASIRTIVNISPVLMGLGTSHVLGRYGRVNWWLLLIVTLLKVYESIVPLYIRQTLLYNSMMPDDLPWFDAAVAEKTIVAETDEKRTEATNDRCIQYITKHKIRMHTLAFTCTKKNEQGAYTIPWVFRSNYVIRFFNFVLRVGSTSDYEAGYALLSEDVSQCKLRRGDSDGVVLVQSQVTCGENIINPIMMSGSHLNTIIILPGDIISGSDVDIQTMSRVVSLLRENQ